MCLYQEPVSLHYGSSHVARKDYSIARTTIRIDSALIRKLKVALHLGEAVDETLEIFGRNTRMAIYDLLKKFGVGRGEILDNPEAFSRGIHYVFGSSSKSIELSIVRRLYKKLGMDSESDENLEFADYVIELSS